MALDGGAGDPLPQEVRRELTRSWWGYLARGGRMAVVGLRPHFMGP